MLCIYRTVRTNSVIEYKLAANLQYLQYITLVLRVYMGETAQKTKLLDLY